MKAYLEEVVSLIKKRDMQSAWRALKLHPAYQSWGDPTKPNERLSEVLPDLEMPCQTPAQQLYRTKLIDMINNIEPQMEVGPNKPNPLNFLNSTDDMLNITQDILLKIAKNIKKDPQSAAECQQKLLDNMNLFAMPHINGLIEIAKINSPVKLKLATAIVDKICNLCGTEKLKYHYSHLFPLFEDNRQMITGYHELALSKKQISFEEYMRNLGRVKSLRPVERKLIQKNLNKADFEGGALINQFLLLNRSFTLFFSAQAKSRVFQYFSLKQTPISSQMFFLLRNCIGEKAYDSYWDKLSKRKIQNQNFNDFKSCIKILRFQKLSDESISSVMTLIWKLLDYHFKEHEQEITQLMQRKAQNNKVFAEKVGIPFIPYQKGMDMDLNNLKIGAFPIIIVASKITAGKQIRINHGLNINDQITNQTRNQPLEQERLNQIQKTGLELGSSDSNLLEKQITMKNPNYFNIFSIIMRNTILLLSRPKSAKLIGNFIVQHYTRFNLTQIGLVKKLYRDLKPYLPQNFYEALIARLGELLPQIKKLSSVYLIIAEFQLYNFDSITINLLSQKFVTQMSKNRFNKILKVLKIFEDHDSMTYNLLKKATEVAFSNFQTRQTRQLWNGDHIAVIQFIAKYPCVGKDVILGLQKKLATPGHLYNSEDLVRIYLQLCDEHREPNCLIKKTANLGNGQHERIYKFLAGRSVVMTQADMQIISDKYFSIAQNLDHVLELLKWKLSGWSPKCMMPFIPKLISLGLEVPKIVFGKHHPNDLSIRQMFSYLLACISLNGNLQAVYKMNFMFGRPAPTQSQIQKIIQNMKRLSQPTKTRIEQFFAKLCENNSELSCYLLQKDGAWSQLLISRIANRKQAYPKQQSQSETFQKQ